MFSYNIARKRLSGNGKVGVAVYVVVSRKKQEIGRRLLKDEFGSNHSSKFHFA